MQVLQRAQPPARFRPTLARSPKSAILGAMPDTQNAHQVSRGIDFIHDEVGPNGDQLAGARCQSRAPPVRKQRETVTREDKGLEQVRSCMRIQWLKIFDDRIPIIERAGTPLDLHSLMLGSLEFQAFDFAQHINPHLIVRYARAVIRTRFRNSSFKQLAFGFKIGIGRLGSLAHAGFIAHWGPRGPKIWLARPGRAPMNQDKVTRSRLVRRLRIIFTAVYAENMIA